jgi:hypothetical protein
MLIFIIMILLGLGYYDNLQHAREAERNKILSACESDHEYKVIKNVLARVQ